MTKLIFKLEQTLSELFIIQNNLSYLELDYDEDLICDLKNQFINRYKLILSQDQIDYISNI
jgi:hypothetical protein